MAEPRQAYSLTEIDPDDIGLVILQGRCHRCRIVVKALAVEYASTHCGIGIPRDQPITVAMENEGSMSEAAARGLELCDDCFTPLERAVHDNLRSQYE